MKHSYLHSIVQRARFLAVLPAGLLAGMAAPANAQSDDAADAPFLQPQTSEWSVSADASITYDSNIFANSSEESDWIWGIRPQVEFRRIAGLIGLDAGAGVDIGFFTHNSSYNYQDFFGFLQLSYPQEVSDSRWEWNLLLDARESSSTDQLLSARTNSRIYTAGGDVRYLYSDKTAIRGLANYRYNDMLSAGFTDTDTTDLGVDAVWLYSPKLDFYLGYRYRHTRWKRMATSSANDHGVELGVEGELAPKLVGVVSIGYTHRDFNQGSSKGMFSAGATLNWAMRQGTTVSLDGRHGFDATETGQSVEASDVTLKVTQEINAKLDVEGSIGYSHYRYSNVAPRNDDLYGIGAAVNYTFTDHVSARFGYTFTHRHSTQSVYTYDRHLVSLSSNFRF